MNIASMKDNFPGLSVATITGLAALFLSEHYGAPAMLFALLLGIALNFLHQESQCQAGIEFTASAILRIGVALLGFRISFTDLTLLGWPTVTLLIVAIASTILIGMVLSRLLGINQQMGALTGGSVAICGASAAMAISAVMPNSPEKERDTLLTIIGVTSLSTIAMVLYPIIASKLGLNELETSIFLGGTIHDVAQVVGAGYSVSEQTGDMSALVKLVRVSFLMPVVFVFLYVIKLKCESNNTSQKAPGFPGFLIAFVIFMTINSLIDLPTQVNEIAGQISQFALIISITAIGMKSNLGKLFSVGVKPILLMVLETIWIAVIILCGMSFVVDM